MDLAIRRKHIWSHFNRKIAREEKVILIKNLVFFMPGNYKIGLISWWCKKDLEYRLKCTDSVKLFRPPKYLEVTWNRKFEKSRVKTAVVLTGNIQIFSITGPANISAAEIFGQTRTAWENWEKCYIRPLFFVQFVMSELVTQNHEYLRSTCGVVGGTRGCCVVLIQGLIVSSMAHCDAQQSQQAATELDSGE